MTGNGRGHPLCGVPPLSRTKDNGYRERGKAAHGVNRAGAAGIQKAIAPSLIDT